MGLIGNPRCHRSVVTPSQTWEGSGQVHNIKMGCNKGRPQIQEGRFQMFFGGSRIKPPPPHLVRPHSENRKSPARKSRWIRTTSSKT